MNTRSQAIEGRHEWPRLAGATILVMAMSSTAVADEASDLANKLSGLRMEVETLSSDLDLKKEDHRARMRSLASQKAELEMDLQREELRLKQLRVTQGKQKEKVAKNEKRKSALAPALVEAARMIRRAIESGLPFKTQERLADIDALMRQLEDGTLSVPVVLSRLWSKVEDELRLARESGLYKQIVIIDGKEMLTDVARLGMFMLFFTTHEGEYGRAVSTATGWEYRLYVRDEDHEKVASLFDAFKKSIRSGYFELPFDRAVGAAP